MPPIPTASPTSTPGWPTSRRTGLPARAATILHGLGFNAEQQQRPCRDFSGGWRMRVALAAVLFSEPDLLLLDEPTNHLDLEATLWLEDYLKRYPHTVLLVSHDRDLLNKVVDKIVHLEALKLTVYSGGYDTFEKTRALKIANIAAAQKKQEAQRAHMQAFIDRFRYKASKARQAQSRIKMLARMEPIVSVAEEQTIEFDFPNPDQLAPPILALDHVDAGYEPGRPVLRNLNLRLDMDDRIAPPRRQRQRQVDLGQAAGRPAPTSVRHVAQIGQAARRLFRPASDRRIGRQRDAGADHGAPGADRRSSRSGAPISAGSASSRTRR